MGDNSYHLSSDMASFKVVHIIYFYLEYSEIKSSVISEL